MADEIEQDQKQLIALLLKHKDLVSDYNENPLEMEIFDPTGRMLLHGIREAHENGVQLTRKSFLEFCRKHVGKKQEIGRLEMAFNEANFASVNRNDFPMLKAKILDAYLLRTAGNYVREFAKNKEEKGTQHAISTIAAQMGDLVASSRDKAGKIIYEDLTKFGQGYFDHMLAVRAGTVPDAEFISFGIQELDETSGVGLAPGTMTLFCGDVGGFKSTMMMNVGLHAWWKEKYNVLYVPLEMPRDLVYDKVLCRQTQIPFDKIRDPKTLSDDEVERIRKYSLEDAPANEAKFYVMDSYEQRTSVNLIKRMIERNLEIFKPRVVIVDYIANLQSDKKQDRADIEIGEMLKDLRYMGRPGVVHEEGFAIVSGAQIGREGLKRVRRSDNDKAMFFSEDLRGSHDYSADADTIYAQFPDPQQPDERLQVFVVKARYGKKSFPDGTKRALLEIKPAISLIRSAADYYAGADKSDVLKKAAADESDFDFATPAASTDDSTATLSDIDDMFGTGSSKPVEATKSADAAEEFFNGL